MAVEAVSRQCFVVVCAFFRVRPATASRGHATNQRQPEQTIWGQMQGTFFLPSAIQSPAILALTGLRGNVPMQEERKRRVEKRWKYIWSALVIIIFGRRNGHSRMHGSMATLQNESGPLFSSCPGANIGGGRRSPAQRRRRGGQEIGWSTRPGGLCRPVPNVYRHRAGRLAPASPGTGRVVVFFPVPFPASGSTRASESPLSRRDNIAASCSFQRPSRASSLFPPLLIPSFGLDTRSRRPRPTPPRSFWQFHLLFYLIHRSLTRRSRCT